MIFRQCSVAAIHGSSFDENSCLHFAVSLILMETCMKLSTLLQTMLVGILCLAAVTVQAQWIQSAEPGGGTINFLYNYEGRFFACAAGGLFMSTDNGKSWKQSDAGMKDQYILCMTAAATTYYVGTENGVFMSTNSGASWKDVNIPVTRTPVRTITIAGGDILASLSGSLYRLINNGKTWIQTTGDQFNKGVVTCFVQRDADVLAGTDEGGIYCSCDNGVNWKQINPGKHSYYDITALHVNGKYVYAGTSSGIYRFAFDGSHWNETQTGMPNIGVSNILSSGSDVFATAFRSPGYAEILVSSDIGSTWDDVTEGLFSRNAVSAFAISGSDLYVATIESGMWKRPLNEMVILGAENIPVASDGLFLAQNYPNPFSHDRDGGTNVSYFLPSAATVQIDVYDALGRHIDRILSDFQSGGNHIIKWTGQTEDHISVSTGAYRCVISSNGISRSRTIIVAK